MGVIPDNNLIHMSRVSILQNNGNQTGWILLYMYSTCMYCRLSEDSYKDVWYWDLYYATCVCGVLGMTDSRVIPWVLLSLVLSVAEKIINKTCSAINSIYN